MDTLDNGQYKIHLERTYSPPLSEGTSAGGTIESYNTFYYNGMYLQHKGLEMLDNDEVKQLLAIRERGKEIIECQELPSILYLKIGSLLASLYSKLTPTNLSLAEHCLLSNLNRIEALDAPYDRTTY